MGLGPSRQALSPGWMAQGGVQTDKWMVEWMENLPILLDFIPYSGRCLVPSHDNKKNIPSCNDHLIIDNGL